MEGRGRCRVPLSSRNVGADDPRGSPFPLSAWEGRRLWASSPRLLPSPPAAPVVSHTPQSLFTHTKSHKCGTNSESTMPWRIAADTWLALGSGTIASTLSSAPRPLKQLFPCWIVRSLHAQANPCIFQSQNRSSRTRHEAKYSSALPPHREHRMGPVTSVKGWHLCFLRDPTSSVYETCANLQRWAGHSVHAHRRQNPGIRCIRWIWI